MKTTTPRPTMLAFVAAMFLSIIPLRAQQDSVTDCPLITAHPWYVDFDTDFDCWLAVGDYDWTKYNLYNNTGIRGSSSGHSMIASPAVALPADSTGLRLYWSDVQTSNTFTYYVLVSRGERMNLDDYDTLFTSMPGNGSFVQRSVSLADYAGDTVYIAFHQKYQRYKGRAGIFHVAMYNSAVPIGNMEVVADAVAIGDTVRYAVHLTQAADSLLTFSWHSTMLDTTFITTDSTLVLVYPVTGSDTLTVTVSNAYGTLVLQSGPVDVYDCSSVGVIPWEEDFSYDGHVACWIENGFNRRTGSYGIWYEDGSSGSFVNLMWTQTAGSYMLTRPIMVPADADNLALMVEFSGRLDVRVSSTASTDTASYTDHLLHEPYVFNCMKSRWVNLSSYAGQTIRVGLFCASNRLDINRLVLDYDTLPMVIIAGQEKTTTDSATLFVASLRHGSTEGLHYAWHSAAGGTIATNAAGDSAWITYGVAVPGGVDTVRVIATNDYGTDTTYKAIRIVDCTPATTLPWVETFADGIVCWYKPEGSNFISDIPYSYEYYERYRYLKSTCNSDTADHWIVSKAIVVPSDTNLEMVLEWKVGSSNTSFVHTYQVLATSSDDFTDTSLYIPLYFDSSAHGSYTRYDNRAVSLRQFAGQTIHIAFRNRPVNYVGTNVDLLFDDITVRTTCVPVVNLTADNSTYYYGDTATFTAILSEGITNGLTYTWHSTLLDTTATINYSQSTFRLNYGLISGYDTITVVAANAYGSDTATIVVHSNIIFYPEATFTHTEAFVGDTTVFAAVLNRCVPDSLTYIWRSSLLGGTVATGPMTAVIYPAEGTDTVTLIVTNAYGADTVVSLVPIAAHPLPQITLIAPSRVNVPDSATYSIALNDCSTNGLVLTCNSILLDTTLILLSPYFTLHYTLPGVDTVTIIATNNYGTDTAVAVVNVLDCSVCAVPYYMDFENVAATEWGSVGEIPDCWISTHNGSNAAHAPHVIPASGYPYLGNMLPSKALLMIAGSSYYGNQAKVILPHFADSLHLLSLAFDYRFESAYAGVLSVGYHDTADNFVTVKNFQSHTGSYRRDTVVFDSATLPDAQIVLRWTHGSAYFAVAIDNIHVFIDNNIPAPTGLTADNLTASCATLRWNAVTGATAYHLILPGIVDTLVADTALTVCGLEEDSDYSFSVYAHVGDEVGHFSGYHPFRTLLYCPPLVSLDANVAGFVRWQYDTTGEALGNGVVLEIADLTSGTTWTDTVWADSTAYPFAIGHRYSLTARTLCGNAEAYTTLTIPLQIPAAVCSEFHGSTASGYNVFIGYDYSYNQMIYTADEVSSAVDTIFGAAFYVANALPSSSSPRNRKVDVYLGHTDESMLTSLINASNLTLVVQDAVFDLSDTGWSRIMFDTPFVYDGASNLVVVFDDNTGSMGGYPRMGMHMVESTRYRYICGHGNYNPYTLNFNTSASEWMPDIQFLGGCASARCLPPVVEVDNSVGQYTLGFSWPDDTTGTHHTVIAISDLTNGTSWVDTAYGVTYTPSGLVSGHRYSFSVRTLCDIFSPIDVVTVFYQQAPNPCAEVASTGVPSNPRFLDNYWNINYSQIVYPATFIANVDTLYGISLRLAQNTVAAYPAYRIAFDIYVGETAVMPTTPIGSNSLIKVSSDITVPVTSNPGWVDLIFDTPYIIDGGGNLIVTLLDRSYYSIGNFVFGVHADPAAKHFIQSANDYYNSLNPSTLNFNWEVSSDIPDIRLLGGCASAICTAPDVEVTSTTSNSVDLAWTRRGAGSLWLVEYAVDGTNDWVVADTTSATFFTITTVSPATHYQVRVASICGGDTLYSIPLATSTLCGPINTPYTVNFRPDDSPCWTLNSYDGNSFNGQAYLSSNDYVMSPEIVSSVDISDLRVVISNQYYSFAADYDARLAVGVCNASAGNITWIDTIRVVNTNPHNDIAYFNQYTGNERHIIVRLLPGHPIFLNAITLETIDGCSPVRNLVTVQTTPNGAQVQWNLGGDSIHSFAVYLDGTLQGVTSNLYYTFTSLNPHTRYRVAVREICRPGDTAAEVSHYFRTECTPVASLPYFEEFDYAPLWEDTLEIPQCWNLVNTDGHARVTFSNWGSDVLTIMYFSNYSTYIDPATDQPNYLNTPAFSTPPQGALVSFKCSAIEENDSISVGIMLSPGDGSTFIPVTTVRYHPGRLVWYEFSTDTIAACAGLSTYAVAFRWEGENSGKVDSLIVTALPTPDTVWHTVTIHAQWMEGWEGAAEDLGAYVTGAGTYLNGDTVTLSAAHFKCPSGLYGWVFVPGDTIMENPYSFLITSDTVVTAVFMVGVGVAEVVGTSFALYPNPASTEVTLDCGGDAEALFIDFHGREVLRTRCREGKNRINISSLPAGVYYVRLANALGSATLKLVIQ